MAQLGTNTGVSRLDLEMDIMGSVVLKIMTRCGDLSGKWIREGLGVRWRRPQTFTRLGATAITAKETATTSALKLARVIDWRQGPREETAIMGAVISAKHAHMPGVCKNLRSEVPSMHKCPASSKFPWFRISSHERA